MTTEKPIQVLFLDDDTDIRSSMQADAAKKRIILKCFSSLEEGLEELQKNQFIRFVILDAKGFIRPDQVKGTENDSFALKAHFELVKLANLQNRYLPYCYFTGHSDLRSTYEGVGEFVVFDKNDDGVREKLFSHVWSVYYSSEEGKLRKRFNDLFEATDLINTVETTKSLTNLINYLHNGGSDDPIVNLKGIFADIRSLQELIYKTLNSKNQTVVPSAFFQANGMIMFNKVKKHLSGNKDSAYNPTTKKYQNDYIEGIANSIYWATSDNIHSSLSKDYNLSKHGINALICNVFELLIWFRSVYIAL